MAESKQGSSSIALLVSWAATALAAVFVGQNLPTDPGRAAATKKAATATAAISERHGSPPAFDEDSALRPLHEAVVGEATPIKGTTLEHLRKLRAANELTVECLVAIVPDPMHSSLSFRFDETIDAIEAAAGALGYLLERWRRPWAEPRGEEVPKVDLTLTREGQVEHVRGRAPIAAEPVSKTGRVVGDPGALVFRRTPDTRKSGRTEAPPLDLLVVMLVADSPTQGVDRLALERALDLSEVLGALALDPRRAQMEDRPPLYLVGPCFSGSMPSLRDGLKAWLDDPGHPTRGGTEVRVVSGMTSAFDKPEFERAFLVQVKSSSRVTFASMVHRTQTVQDAVLRYLGVAVGPPSKVAKGPARSRTVDIEGDEGGTRVAILSELDTVVGESVEIDNVTSLHYPKSTLTTLRYPLHVAEIRSRYESQGLLRDRAAEVFRDMSELRATDEAAGKVHDVFPNQTPEGSTVSEDRVLSQTLRYLEDSRFHIIGLVSTVPRDTIFLARLVRRYCPDARIFTVASDLIFLDPGSLTDLRGMLVGSTYPLYAPNHRWTGAEESGRRQVFPSQHAHGTYNAAYVQLSHVLNADDTDKWKGLSEYFMPRALASLGESNSVGPPVWISVVGERALYPVDCRLDLGDHKWLDADYLWRPDDGRATHLAQGPTALRINRVVGWMVLYVLVTLTLLSIQARRLLRGREAAGVDVPRIDACLQVAIAGLIGAGFAFVASPLVGHAFRRINLNLAHAFSSWWTYALLYALGLALGGVSLWAGARNGRSRSGAFRWAEVVAVAIGGIAAFGAQVAGIWGVDSWSPLSLGGSAWWPLSLDRSCSITGGVSAYLPTVLVMVALGAWAQG
jgi:hypothetical protein